MNLAARQQLYNFSHEFAHKTNKNGNVLSVVRRLWMIIYFSIHFIQAENSELFIYMRYAAEWETEIDKKNDRVSCNRYVWSSQFEWDIVNKLRSRHLI